MITIKIKQIAAARAKIARLERAVESEIRDELSGLHDKYGFPDMTTFLDAVQAAVTGDEKVGPQARQDAAKIKRKRAVITARVRARVGKLVKAGKSGAAIAESVGISLPSVQNIKKALGLVTPRLTKKKSKAAKPAKAAKSRPRKKAAAAKPVAPAPAAAASEAANAETKPA